MNLADYKNKTLLFLGKPRAFSQEEFDAQLTQHNITTTKEPQEGVTTILEGRMMTPLEQNLSDRLYESGAYSFIGIDIFESALAKEIDDNLLLMSLKLSGDKYRLKSFLQNSCIGDGLFFKLLAMYKWGGEDFFENDDNRDVTAALIGRFYENIERNHNVQYATTGLIHLVAQTQQSVLLEALGSLEPIKKHPKLLQLIAKHPQTPKSLLKKLLREGDAGVKEALCSNKNLPLELLLELFNEPKYGELIAQNRLLCRESFSHLKAYDVALAHNTTLDSAMQEELFDLQKREIFRALASNSALTQALATRLFSLQDQEIQEILLTNSALDTALLREAYKEPKYHLSLAHNTATPQDIIEALYGSGDVAILAALAANEATPIELLYQLQLDSRFSRAVETNAAFGRHIQSQNIGWLV